MVRMAIRLARILLVGTVVGAVVGLACAAESEFEQRYREWAERLMGEARWYEAAVQWEVLQLLRPDRNEYGSKAQEARSRARDAAAQRARTAAETRQRGDLQNALQLYLQALSEDPGYSEAARALRELEKEQLGRASGRSLAHLSGGEAAGPRTAPRRGTATSAAEGRELESARKDIAQDYYERGVRAQRTDLDEAIRLWERALQYDPDLTQARLRMEQARRMRQNLESIQGADKP